MLVAKQLYVVVPVGVRERLDAGNCDLPVDDGEAPAKAQDRTRLELVSNEGEIATSDPFQINHDLS
jgi:hypothetical protein